MANEDIDKKLLNAEFSIEEIRNIIDDFYHLGTRLIYLLGGEPLVHKHIGELVNYTVDKGILLHIITNGTLIEKKLEEIKRAHMLCISLDGIGPRNDDIRGPKVFERAVAGIEAALKKGMKCRIHSVITAHNIDSFEEMAQLAKDLGVLLTVSPLNYIGGIDPECSELEVSDERYREFWKFYRGLKEKGYPIGNTYSSIDMLANWPLKYHEMMSYDTPLPDNFKRPERCVNGDIYCGLSADGTMYHCIQMGCFTGPNIHEVGIKKAWEEIVATRPNCVACASMNTVENTHALRLYPENLLTGFRYQLLKRT